MANNEIRADKARISAPLTMLVASIMAAVPVSGVYWKLDNKVEQLERDAGAQDARIAANGVAINLLQKQDIEYDKVLSRIDFQMGQMVKSQEKIEKFVDDFRGGRLRLRSTGGNQ